MCVYVDGELIPRKPLFLKFSEAGGENFIAGFQSLFSGTWKLSHDVGNQIEEIIVLATQPSALTCHHTTAQVIILSLQNREIFFWSFILDKHSTTRLTSSFSPSSKTWSRLTRVETFCTTTQTRMNSTQLAIILTKDKYTRALFQEVHPSDKPPKRVSSFPALFIANVDTSEKPGSLWVAFYFTKDQKWEFFGSSGLPSSNYTRAFSSFLNNNSNSNGWSFNACIMLYFTVVILVWAPLYIVFLKINNVMIFLLNALSKNIFR